MNPSNKKKDARLPGPDGQGKRDARVLEVIPISRGVARPALSYFTTRNISVGDFVRVPVRNTLVPAIVAAVHNASSAKTDLKQSTYSLKKIPTSTDEGEPEAHIPDAFLAAVQKTAEYYACSLGSLLGTLIPKIFFDNPSLVWNKEEVYSKPESPQPKNEPLVMQLEMEERMSQYKSIIRESLAKKKSIKLIVPTEEEATRTYAQLSKGIEDYAYLFTLGGGTRAQKKVIKAVKESEHPILLVTTPAGIALDRPDLDTIILERESSRAYRTLTRPFVHFRVFLEFYSSKSKKRLILGDSVLSVETLRKEKAGEYREFFPLSWRITPPSESELVDMKRLPVPGAKPEFHILSPELKELIAQALSEERGIFLFGARKGLAPTTICEDCETILSCQNCGAPVVLYEMKGASGREDSRVYICHACSARRSAETRCDMCKSWRLSPLGIGIDRIREEVKEHFPDARVYVLDKHNASTPAKAKKVVEEFKKYGGVLVGTELGFLYLDKVPYTALVAADSLFSIPDFGIHERIFYLVTRLREMAEHATIIQTRNIGKQILAWATSGNILDFYRSEIADREEMLYPPFSLFVKISLPKTGGQAGKNVREIKTHFEKWSPDVVRDTLIIRLPRDKWPDPELVSALSLLTPDFLIKVDPESIL